MSTPTTAPRSPDTSWWPVALIGGLMALAVWLWASAGIAGLLFGDGWPAGGLGVAGRVMRDLPGHLTDPRLAWPPAAQSTLPGPVPMYGVSAGLLALVLGLVAVVAVRWQARIPSGSDRARWAVTRDLQDLVVAEDPGRASWPPRARLRGAGREAAGRRGPAFGVRVRAIRVR